MGLDDHELPAPNSWPALPQWDSSTILTQTEHQSLSSWPVLNMEDFGHFFIFLLLKITQIHLLLYWRTDDLLIHAQAAFNLVARISGHEILLLFLQVCLLMQLLALLLCMGINFVMVARVFALVCYGFPFFSSFPPFFFFFPSLEASCCSFCFNPLDYALFKPMFSKYCACTQASSTDLGLNNITCSRRWRCRPPKYLRSTPGFLLT